MKRKLAPPAAESSRDSLAKALFGRLFSWLVQRVNKLMKNPDMQDSVSIGILDIFGFEIMKHNSFEQLCINYCNEKLQQHFLEFVFKKETEIYIKEGIDYEDVKFQDNQDMLDLIEKKPRGLFPTLDEELVVASGSDKGFFTKFVKRADDCPKRVNKSKGTFREGTSTFVLRHYAGEVAYDPCGFLVKNKDELLTDLKEVMKKSKLLLVQELFSAESDASILGGKKSSSRKKGGMTLSRLFTTQLQSLMSVLRSSAPHFIRCIKPNTNKSSTEFDAHLVMQQLQFAGVIDAVEVRKHGFPFRRPHAAFVARYLLLLTHEDKRKMPKEGSSSKANADRCKMLVKMLGQRVRHSKQQGTLIANILLLGTRA